MADATYHDGRSEFWRRQFGAALDYEAYLAASPSNQAEKWRAMADRLQPLLPDERGRLASLDRELNVLVYSGAWCGDCVRQGPMLQRIAAATRRTRLRLIDRDASIELQEELRLVGALRVPVVVFLSEDFWEIGRFGDRMLTVYRSKARRELGPACDAGLIPPPPDELAAEQSEWVAIVERMLWMLRLSPPLRERHRD